jgi:hypothetical protein
VAGVWPVALPAAILLISAGCTKPAEAVKEHKPPPPPSNVQDSVSGRITYHGVGLASGFVEIVGPDGKSAQGTVRMGGIYTVWDPPHGHVKISVSTQPPTGLSAAPPAKHSGNKLPERYADPDTSGLTLEVGGGKQTFNIALTD